RYFSNSLFKVLWKCGKDTKSALFVIFLNHFSISSNYLITLVVNHCIKMISETLLFLNIGTSEMILILVVALFFFGGRKLQELARGLGRGIREFKEASETIKRDISDQINNFEKDLEIKDEPKAIAQHATDNEASTYGDSGQDNPEDVSPDQYYQNHDYDYNYPEETVDHPIA